MKRQWTNEELLGNFTILSKELDVIGESKADHNVLGFAVLLKYFQSEGRFPSQKQDVPPIVIVYLAQQLGVVPEKIIAYDWDGRTIKAHRAAIRTFLGVHEATLSDEEAVIEGLCQHTLAEQRQEDALIASVYAHCKKSSIEPPTPDRVRRLVHTAIHRFDERLCTSLVGQLSAETRRSLDTLLTVTNAETEEQQETSSTMPDACTEEEPEGTPAAPAPPRPQSALHFLKQDAGPVGLESVMRETEKLERIHQLGLPADLFAHVSAKILDGYRNRIAVEELHEVRRHPDALRLTLLAAYCWRRRQEIVDTLVDLLIDVAHHLVRRQSGVWRKPSSKISKRSPAKPTCSFTSPKPPSINLMARYATSSFRS